MSPPRRKELLEAAREAAGMAYAPHSRYAVGAAILTTSGDIVTGCNVENASFGLSLCAERGALMAARVRGLVDPVSSPIVAAAVVTTGPAMPWPCGACRQVLREFASSELPLAVEGPNGIVETTLGDLLPNAFALGEE